MKITVFLLLLISSIYGDILKENYITLDLNSSQPDIVLDFESDNLEQFILLDTNENGLVSWKEIKAKKKEIIDFVLPHLKIYADGKICQKELMDFKVHRRVHQSYIKLNIKLLCPKPKDEVKLFYDLFFDVDRSQKAFLSFSEKNSSQPMMLSYRKNEISVKLEKISLFKTFMNFLIEGVWHIWIGFDHILFLLMLLIPSVIYYEGRERIPHKALKKVLINVLKIVTAFSIAHSITLALSVLGIVEVDTRFIEVAIALSVLFTALNNIFIFIRAKSWLLAFGFGLIHGFGFANVLNEMKLSSQELIQSLLGFNIGVEIGQIAIVLVVVPLIFFTRYSGFYKYIILYGLSIVTAIISALWAYERYFDLSILPF